jgi:hypothetical protein
MGKTRPYKYIHTYYSILKSYISERSFVVKMHEETFNSLPIQAGVPQGSLLGPLLHNLCTHDLPTSPTTTIGIFADDTAISASHEDPIAASSNLQEHFHLIEKWSDKWKIKVDCVKSTQTTFTLRKGTCTPVHINRTNIQQADQDTYLGIALDSKLTWRPHILKKRKQMDLRAAELNWLIGHI